MTSIGTGPRAGMKQKTCENPVSVTVIGILPGLCSYSSSISSFRGHLMTAQTGYFSCPHIAIDLEKVNWCPTEISRNWLHMQRLWWSVWLGETNVIPWQLQWKTDNFHQKSSEWLWSQLEFTFNCHYLQWASNQSTCLDKTWNVYSSDMEKNYIVNSSCFT